MFGWLNAHEATEVGQTLADEFAQTALGITVTAASRKGAGSSRHLRRTVLQRSLARVQSLNMNFYKRARMLNAFRWRLLEQGVDGETALEATQTLTLHLTSEQKAGLVRAAQSAAAEAVSEPVVKSNAGGNARNLLSKGKDAFARGAFEDAAEFYERFIELKPGNADAFNQVGLAYYHLGHYGKAEDRYRKAISRDSHHTTAHGNLGALLLTQGLFPEAETSLRRALKLTSDNLDVRANLGMTLLHMNRLPEALTQLEKVLRVAPRHAEALYGMGVLARAEGRFEDATGYFEKSLEADPKMSRAWAAMAGLRKWRTSDEALIKRGEQLVSAGATLSPVDAAGVRFALGKIYDDLGRHEIAFTHFQRANETLKATVPRYDRAGRTQMVDDLIRTYTPEVVAGAHGDESESQRPVFVVGMMRSGTSLTEQILASHPAVSGAGELYFWSDVAARHGAELQRAAPSPELTRKIAADYLHRLEQHSAQALRVIDKAPVNSDFLGIIHRVFPRARFIYMRRDPIDTCLSCYFQPFAATLSFTLDLSDLAHYYLEHQRLMAHWRSVLPAGSLLEVPYEALVADQAGWTRKLIEFLGLDWDDRCLDFHRSARPVITASCWQVRQKIYSDSVGRWRPYKKLIRPLLQLQEK